MLLANNHQIVIPTATKTGTRSMESALAGHGFTQTMPRHSHQIPREWHKARPWFMVRNPYARMVSMYRFGVATDNSFLRKAGADGFVAFLANWLDARALGRPHDWITLQSEYVAAAEKTNQRKVLLWCLEDDGVKELIAALKGIGYPITVAEKHINKSHDKFEEDWEEMWDKKTKKLVKDILEPDMELWQRARG